MQPCFAAYIILWFCRAARRGWLGAGNVSADVPRLAADPHIEGYASASEPADFIFALIISFACQVSVGHRVSLGQYHDVPLACLLRSKL